MPAPLNRDCPIWCQHHHCDDQDESVRHTARLGVAGPVEVVLTRWVYDYQADPITELELTRTDPDGSIREQVTMPYDVDAIVELRALLGAAVSLAR